MKGKEKMHSQNPIEKTFNRFLVRTTVISLVFFVLAGTATVRQRAQETMTGQTAPVCSFIDEQEEIGIRFADKKIVLKREVLEKAAEYFRDIRAFLSGSQSLLY